MEYSTSFNSGFGFGFGNDTFSTVFTIAAIAIGAVILVVLIRGILQWNKNNHSPKLTVDALVVSKRTHFSSRHSRVGSVTEMHNYNSMASTQYYVTFEVDSRDRVELKVSGSEYGMLAEGDRGKLTFQGTRYLGFDRA